MPKIELLNWIQEGPWKTTATWRLFITRTSNGSFSVTIDRSGKFDPEFGCPSWRGLRSPAAVLNAIDLALESVGAELQATWLKQITRKAKEIDSSLAAYLRAQLRAAQDVSIVIEEREQSTMVSTWKEYLCLETTNDKGRALVIKGYTALGYDSDYRDENGELLKLPAEIEGHKVVSVDDGLIVGEPLVPREEYPEHELTADANDAATKTWLERRRSRILTRRIGLMLRLASSDQGSEPQIPHWPLAST